MLDALLFQFLMNLLVKWAYNNQIRCKMTGEINPCLELDMEFSLNVISEYRSSKSVFRKKKKRTIFILFLRVQCSDKFSLPILTQKSK